MAGKALRVLRGVMWAGTLALVLAGAGLAWVLLSEAGTRVALLRAQGMTPDLAVTRVSGTLWQGVTLHEVRYAKDGLAFETDRLWLELAWPALMQREVHVRRAGVDGARLSLPAADADATAPAEIDLGSLVPALPFAIWLEAVDIQRLTLVRAPDLAPVHVESLKLSARAGAESLELEQLTLVLAAPLPARVVLAAQLGLEAALPVQLTLHAEATLAAGQADLSLASSGPLTALSSTGTLRWRGVELPSADARFALTHGFDSAVIDALQIDTLQGTLRLAGELDWAEGVSWALNAHASGLQPGALGGAVAGPLGFELVSRGRRQADGTLDHATRLTEGMMTLGGLAISGLRLDVSGTQHALDIDALSASLLDGALQAAGRLGWRDGIRWSLSADAAGLDPGQVAEAAAGRVGFSLQSEGTLDDDGQLAHLTLIEGLTGELAGVGFDALRLQASGDLARIQIDEFSGRVLGARLGGGGELHLGEVPAWSLQMSLDEADLGLLAEHVQPALSGWVGFDVSSRGQWREGQPFGELLLTQLRGRIDGQALAGRVAAELAGDTVRVSPLEITLGVNQLRLSGQLTPPFDVAFAFELPALDALPVLPQLGIRLFGALSGEGEIGGTLRLPQVDVRLDARDLQLDDTVSLGRLGLRAELRASRVAADARLVALAVGDARVAEAEARVDGSLQQHQAQFDARTGQGRITLAGVGGLGDDSAWGGRLDALTLSDTVLGDWALTAPAQLAWAGNRFAVDAVCLAEAAERGGLCAEATRSPNGRLQGALEGWLALAVAQPWLPPNLALPGRVVFHGSGSQLGERIEANARLSLPDDIVLFSGLVDESLRIDYQDVAVQVHVADGQLQAQLGARLPRYGELVGELDAALDADGPLGGRIRFDMDDIGWLEAFVGEITELGGRARAAIELGGTVAQPRPVGELHIEQVALSVPMLGVSFVDGALRLAVDEQQQFAASGQLAGREQGLLRISGEGRASLPDWRLALRLDGDALALMRTPEVDLDISPALRVAVDPQGTVVSGRMVLPRVAVRVHTLPEGSVRESPDLVLASATEPATPTSMLRADLDIVLGERVSLEGMGFATGLVGQIRLRGDATAPLAAFGEVDLRDGRYSAYGQNLTVDQGRLSFNGPLDDPGLDVRASRTVGEYRAGLEIRGTLMNPRSQVFSVPALPESDALSVLFTGRLLSAGTTGADAALLVTALAGLGVSQGDEILRDIGQTVGLDELGLDAGEGFTSTQLSIGKRLSSRLMVRYAVGVFDGVGRFVTEYRINRFLDLEIVSSPVAQGGDLIYRIER